MSNALTAGCVFVCCKYNDGTRCGITDVFVVVAHNGKRVLAQRALAPQQTKSTAATQLFILGDTSYGADHCDEVNAEVASRANKLFWMHSTTKILICKIRKVLYIYIVIKK